MDELDTSVLTELASLNQADFDTLVATIQNARRAPSSPTPTYTTTVAPTYAGPTTPSLASSPPRLLQLHHVPETWPGLSINPVYFQTLNIQILEHTKNENDNVYL